jgi:hypothetical protein
VLVCDTGPLVAAACNAGARAEALFLRSLADGDFIPKKSKPIDYQRIAGLIERYTDLPLGATDASVIALAEPLKVREVATLDRRHVSIVRPRHTARVDTVAVDDRASG